MLQLSLVRALIATMLVAVSATVMLSGTGRAAPPVSPAAAARGLLSQAEGTVHAIGAQAGGSYVHVGLLNLHKLGLLRIARSSTVPFVSAASGTAHAFTVTVTAEPGGQTFTATG